MNKPRKSDQPSSFYLDGGPPEEFKDPRNKLERTLIELSQRKISVPEFMEKFFNTDVYIALPNGQLQTTGDKTTLVENPTAFSLKHADYNTVCLYSHPSRIAPTTKKFPEFEHEFKVLAGDFIFGIQGDIGLTINPYWDINFEWSNKQITEMKRVLKRGKPETFSASDYGEDCNQDCPP